MAKKLKSSWNIKQFLGIILTCTITTVLIVQVLNSRRDAEIARIMQILPHLDANAGGQNGKLIAAEGVVDPTTTTATTPQTQGTLVTGLSAKGDLGPHDNEILARLESLALELEKSQKLQAQKFERERRILEKKITNLRGLPPDLTLLEKLAFLFPYDPARRFPAYIWQTWNYDKLKYSKGTRTRMRNRRLLNDLKSNKQNWDDKNPGFVHEVLSDKNMEALVHYHYHKIPEIITAFDSLPSTVLKVDFFKYLVLLAKGGLYADMDTVPLQPIPNWIPEDMDPLGIGLLVGIEYDSPVNDQTVWKNTYARRLQFGNWIIQAKPGHPVLRSIVAQITEETLRKLEEEIDAEETDVGVASGSGSGSKFGRNTLARLKSKTSLMKTPDDDLGIMKWTGSGVWTDAVFTYFNDYMKSGLFSKTTWRDFHNLLEPKLLSDVLVFPEFTFNAPAEINSNDLYKDLYFTTHEFKKFWKTGKPREGKEKRDGAEQ